MKGMRQAQSWISASVNNLAMAKDINAPSKIPNDKPAVKVPLAKPTCFGGTCSDTNVHAAGISPPMAMPCTMRINNSNNGAA